MTTPTANHKEEATKPERFDIVSDDCSEDCMARMRPSDKGLWVRHTALSSRDTETQRAVDTLVTAHNSTMDARDKEIREVLEGLRGQFGAKDCWCDAVEDDTPHLPACLAARVLWDKVQEKNV